MGIKHSFYLRLINSYFKLLFFLTTSQEAIPGLVNQWTQRFSKAPTGQIGMMKKAISQSIGESMERSVDYHRYITALMYQTQDHDEGKKAFFEKREPHFIGK
ncbi:hypothetical protein [Peribacillus cavernae]|uniref:hypothetical protein n=1 Tax=Peribacillus cavernae TaxID=1674310 RepID=UPI00163C47BC|nr:hypothetical protein [Peribacillus cavernae]